MSSFDDVRRDWTRLGQDDPLWAVNIAPDTRGNRWDIDQFLATGQTDVNTTRTWLENLGLPTRWQRVLDFGCGAGRLSQALADHATEVVGVDVSEPMLETARRLNRTDGRCHFVHNDSPTLHQFPDASFDLIYSKLVLQHLPPNLIDGYLTEFLRVMKPHGQAVLQCTTSPLWTIKGTIWRFAPGPLIRLGQRYLLRYPAPMRMTALNPRHLNEVVTTHGGEVVATASQDDRATHWRSTHYVIRRLPSAAR